MTHKRLLIVLAGAAVACGLGYWWYSAHAAARQEAAPPAANPNALVALQAVRRQSLPVTLDAFGEVAAARPDALSFPQAGQVTALPVVVGQHVHRGDLLAKLASDPNAISAYTQAANALGFARREQARQQALFGLQLATQAQVDAARKQADDAQAALAALAQLGGAHAGAELRAPYDGVVSQVAAGEGERIGAGATVLQLGRSDRLRVLLMLEPARSRAVRAGMPVTVAPVLEGAAPFDAVIAAAGDLVDPKSQMVTAIVELPDAQREHLVAGTRVQATIVLGRRDAWTVPRQAVLSDDTGAWLFQVGAGKARRVPVTRVAEIGQLYGVDGAVDAALPVVVQGNYELADGMAVRTGEGAR